VTELHAKNGELDLEKQNLADELQQTQAELEKVRSHDSSESTCKQPDLKEIRDRVLAELKLGKQASGYKTTQKALEYFIKFLTEASKTQKVVDHRKPSS
jgi:hypothetical protein